MDAAAGGFSAANSWNNDISGDGGLVKQGSGTLTLAGGNSYRGGTVITGGTLAAASAGALGGGPVRVGAAGTLAVAPGVRVEGTLEVTGTLAVTLAPRPRGAVLSVDGDAHLDGASELIVALTGDVPGNAVLPVLSARRVRGTFGSVSVSTSGYSAVAVYARDSVAVHVIQNER